MHNTQPMALSTPGPALAVAPTALAPAFPVATDMMTLAATCAFFGGDKPLNPSTLYRGIKKGRYPKPCHVGPNSSRWVRSECQEARQKLIDEERDLRQNVGTELQGRAA
jgi:hypothetical protein